MVELYLHSPYVFMAWYLIKYTVTISIVISSALILLLGLCLHGSFNDAARSSAYVASNGRTISKRWIEKKWKKGVAV
jgi:hypothetical protein